MKLKKINSSTQLQLGLSYQQQSAADRPSKPINIKASFRDPSPDYIFLGDVTLQQYLMQNDMNIALNIRRILEKLDFSLLESAYSVYGPASIHPRIMLGLIVYGMLQGRWSLRKLEQLAVADVGAWWVCGGLQPDHSTIGRFIHMHAKALSVDFFVEMMREICSIFKIKTGDVAGDGTVIEAAGSRFRTLKMEAAQQAEAVAKQKAVEAPEDKRAARRAAQAHEAATVARERQEKTRVKKGKKAPASQVCATEPQAPIQPLKNGIYRPSYKPSVLADENRLIVGQWFEPSSETAAINPMLAQYERIFERQPQRMLLDASYFSIEVFNTAVEADLDLLCPSGKADRGQFHRKSKKYDKRIFEYQNFSDSYLCPCGRRLEFQSVSTDQHGRQYRRYKCRDCSECQQREKCTTSKTGRTINRYEGEECKEAMLQVMDDKRARIIYGKRKAMVEPVFSVLRLCQGLTRFHRFGASGAKVEFSLHCIAYNLGRVAGRLPSSRQAFYILLFEISKERLTCYLFIFRF